MRPFQRAVLLWEAFSAQRHVQLAPEPEGARSGVCRPAADRADTTDSADSANPNTTDTSDNADSADSTDIADFTAHLTSEFTGPVPTLTLTAVGDSMVAGCGVSSVAESMVPDIAQKIADILGIHVNWSLDGKLGATMRRVRYRMLPELPAMADHPNALIICAGSNDIMARRTLAEWKDDLRAVVASASEKTDYVIVLSSGQLYKSPSLGKALRKEVERRIDEQTAASAEICAEHGVVFIDMTHTPLGANEAEFWASDNFHPSLTGYQAIADGVVEKLRQRLVREA